MAPSGDGFDAFQASLCLTLKLTWISAQFSAGKRRKMSVSDAEQLWSDTGLSLQGAKKGEAG